MNIPTLIRSGFDTIELAYRASIPEAFLSALARAKAEAIEKRKTIPLTYNEFRFLVEATGGQGGFSYRVDTGPFGAIWKFRGLESKDSWSTHVKIKSHSLATRGIDQSKLDCDNFLRFIGANFDPDDARVGRADFAFDFYAPALEILPSEFVSHARTQKSEIIERVANGDQTNYIRIGKLPGKQVCIYNKSGAINEERDLIWTDILKSAAAEFGIQFGERTVDIWRIELRSGKKQIDKFLNPNRRWDLFDNQYKAIFKNITKSISWRLPQNDLNKTRWPLNPFWVAINNEIILMEFNRHFHVSSEVIEAIKAEYLNQLASQLDGLFLTLAANNGVNKVSLDRFFRRQTDMINRRLKARPDVETELEERAERFRLKFSAD